MGPTSGPFWAELVTSGPIFFRIWPTSVEACPNRSEFGQTSSVVGQTRPRFGQNSRLAQSAMSRPPAASDPQPRPCQLLAASHTPRAARRKPPAARSTGDPPAATSRPLHRGRREGPPTRPAQKAASTPTDKRGCMLPAAGSRTQAAEKTATACTISGMQERLQRAPRPPGAGLGWRDPPAPATP